ncbi:hypothetical protein ElyMa_000884700 [Elysia marginata]|uniref:G-protein coupled receptors family 1 profile domain-containing protein n=1 Tax=Elysia marginata TaxID=1093978 RepID=A0AAV4H6C9_9GAST|nr:hypothetical protein ElyMa_000884700 [Elysia marginata]
MSADPRIFESNPLQDFLLVVSSLLVWLFNARLLLIIIKASGGLRFIAAGPRSVRLLTLVSLMIGDILAGILSNITIPKCASSENEHHESKNLTRSFCKTTNMCKIYLVFLLPFVYGVGLILLAAEGAIFRMRLQTNRAVENPGVFISVLVSAIPWLLGIIIVLPLTLTGINLGDNNAIYMYSNTKGRAIHVVCQVLPVVASIVVTTVSVTMMKNGASYPVYNELAQDDQAADGEPQIFEFQQGGTSTSSKLSQLMSNLNAPPIGAVKYTPASQVISLVVSSPSPTNAGTNFYLMSHEKPAILLATMVYVACVLPMSITFLVYVYNEDPPNSSFLSSLTCFSYLVLIIRSFVSPFMWIETRSFNIKRPDY